MKFVLLDELKKNKCFEFRINRPFPQHQTFTVIALLMTEISCISCNSYCYKSANTYLLNHICRCFADGENAIVQIFHDSFINYIIITKLKSLVYFAREIEHYSN